MKQLRFYINMLSFIMFPFCSRAQNNPYWQEPTRIQVDTLQKVLATSTNDTVKMYVNRQIGMYYQEINRMTALAHFEEMLKLARKINQKVWEAEALSRNGYVSCLIQNYSGGLKYLLMARDLASKKYLEKEMWNPGLLSKKNAAIDARMTILCDLNHHLGIVNYFSGEYSKALEYYHDVEKISEGLNDDALKSLTLLNMGEAYIGLGQLDSAETAFNESINYCDKSGYKKYKGLTLHDIGKIYEMRNNDEEAKRYYRLSIKTNIETESPDFEGMGYQALANISESKGDIDSLFYFSHQALKIYQTINDTLGLTAAYSSLSVAFDHAHQTDSAYQNLKKAIILKDGLNKQGRIKTFQLAGFREMMKLEEQKAEQLRTITKIRTWSFIAGIALLLLMSGIFYRNYSLQRKDKAIIENAFSDLKATQSQLIQSEKMASLGELTAGIAHEIQNPLNFVNNFSEVNAELIKELSDIRSMEGEVRGEEGEVRSQESEERKKRREEEDAIINDLKANSEKINTHGQRASNIVKGMLEHSRKSSGEKSLTDINALCEEYTKLSYQSMRVKDSKFSAEYKMDLDPNLPKVNVIAQDISRVLLNLLNNAFYAVSERKQKSSMSYEPLVVISTHYFAALRLCEIKIINNTLQTEDDK